MPHKSGKPYRSKKGHKRAKSTPAGTRAKGKPFRKTTIRRTTR